MQSSCSCNRNQDVSLNKEMEKKEAIYYTLIPTVDNHEIIYETA